MEMDLITHLDSHYFNLELNST